MILPKALTDEQELALVQDHSDGWWPSELTITYKVSERTVYRTLAKHGAGPTRPKKGGNKKRKKSPRKRPPLQPCGTDAAYRRHKKNGEYPCVPCLAAHSEAEKKYRKPKPSRRKLRPCGTVAAYRRHLKKGEKACDKCLRASAKEMRKYRKKKK